MSAIDDVRKRIDELKSKYDMRAFVADELGQPKERSSSVWIFRCPFGHSDSEPSFAVYPDHAHCFGKCGFHGDIINYVERRLGVNRDEAMKFLGENEDLPKYRPQETATERKAVTLTLTDVERYHFDLGKVKPYLDSRRIPDTVIDNRLIGGSSYQDRRLDKPLSSAKTYIDSTSRRWRFESNWVALPYVFSDRVYSMNFRRDDKSCMEYLSRIGTQNHLDMFRFIQIDLAEKGDKYPDEITREQVLYHTFGPRFYRPEGTPVSAYGVHHLIQQQDDKLIYPRHPYVILCEGEFDQLSCEAEGFTCIAVKKTGNVDIRRIVQNTRLVFVAVDPDEAGEKYANMLMEALGGDYTKVRKMPMPDGKDFNKLRQEDALGDFLSRKPFCLDPING